MTPDEIIDDEPDEFKLVPPGVPIDPCEKELDPGDWERVGAGLAEVHNRSHFDIGDWLLRSPYGDGVGLPTWSPGGEYVERGTYARAHEIIGLAPASLMDIASTCRRMPSSVRTELLSYSHHRVVAEVLPLATLVEKRAALARALDPNHEKQALSVSQFKKLLLDARDPKDKRKDEAKPMGFIVKVSRETFSVLEALTSDHENVGHTAAKILEAHCADEGVRFEANARLEEKGLTLYKKRRDNGLRVAEIYDPLGLQCRDGCECGKPHGEAG